jgi:ankyrin repeat protein/catechol 2,3-dioxygenase-like lactoylglutathione lyase family enzyme
MSNSQLPERVSLEYLKKLAKERLRELRRDDPETKLAAAQLAIAREYGFPSWRALKAEVDRRQGGNIALFFETCAGGGAGALRRLLDADPELVRAANPAGEHGGFTGLHTAARAGHLDAVRLMLERGADPNAREEGDNTYPLHWAAAHRHLEVVRALLDAGGDVHGIGDVHELDAIGWATFFHDPGREPGHNPEVAALLVERGARHHIFSAMSLGDLDLIRSIIERDPAALDRRMSRFEQGLGPLQFAISRGRYDIVDLLIAMGCDLEAKDRSGHTALESAMLFGDREAVARLRAAGAREPERIPAAEVRPGMSRLAGSITRCVPMIYVPDVAAAIDWYVSIGCREVARFSSEGAVNFGIVAFGETEVMINMNGKKGRHDISLWFSTDRVDELYQMLKSRQLAAMEETGEGIDFVEHINDTFYHARQFGIRDLNGYMLYFIQQLDA